ncbi:GNAT family N-acetyltransferase [Tateyamaria sp. SN3-11]|uniref:GNAT family N-acetyltransferase n=1 Tax=Tateyamaria sp. SN3-11 TaxID=3092147 RepID=UPI0039EA2D8E
MEVTLAPLPRADAAWLHRVAAPYFAELAPDIGPIAADRFDIWFSDPNRSAHVICADQDRVGFALIRLCDSGQREISEFCILPDQRSRGIGEQAVQQCLALHLGPWRIGVAGALPGTARFWDRVLATVPGITGLARGPALTPYQCHSYTFTYRDTL